MLLYICAMLKFVSVFVYFLHVTPGALMVSCSLLVFMQKIIFTVKKSTKIVASKAALCGSDIKQIIHSAAGNS